MTDENIKQNQVKKDKFAHQRNSQMKVDFGIANALKKENKAVSMSGDVLFKDIQLFIPELIINIALLVFGVLGIVLMRLVSQNWLNVEIQKQVSPIVFDLIVGHVMFIQTVLMVGIALPIVIHLLIFVAKWFFFYPRGKKVFTLRSWKTGLTRLGVEEIRDNMVKFEPGEEADQMYIEDVRKSWEYYTGRPIVLLEEGMPCNTPIHRHKELNEQVKDYNSVVKSISMSALAWAEAHVKKAQGFMSNPQNWILLIILAAVIVIGFLMFTKGSPTTAITGAVAGMTTKSGAM